MRSQRTLRPILMAVLCLLASLLAACQSANFAPVHERQSPPLHRPDHYRVVSGDTLYSIAFRYGLDIRGLARANQLAKPYTIFPGQRLILREAPAPSSPVRRPKPTVATKPKAPEPQAPRAKGTRPQTTKPAATGTAKSQSKPTVASPKPSANKPVKQWLWPTEGKVVRRFTTGRRVHNGIDIDGRSGQAIFATADGTVVYAGNGLVGYGNLLIIKHNETFLSAYGHNKKLLVKEGDSVGQGDKIATMGDSGTTSIKLHFEIRQNGRPIDPLRLVSQ